MTKFDHNGVTIYYEQHGSGQPLLFMPGFTEGADEPQFEPLVQALAERYHVIAADLPGSGRSLPQPRAYTPHFYHDDARSMVALLDHLGTGPAHVAGFSDGGETALVMAVQHPQQVRSLVAWGAAGTLAVGGLEPVLDAIYDIIDNPIDPLRSWSEQLKSQYGEDRARAMTQSWAEASRAILAEGGDISLSRAHEIKCPTLIITGEYDPFCPPSAAHELASRIPNARHVEAPRAGHTLHADRPEWFTQTVLDWLAEH